MGLPVLTTTMETTCLRMGVTMLSTQHSPSMHRAYAPDLSLVLQVPKQPDIRITVRCAYQQRLGWGCGVRSVVGEESGGVCDIRVAPRYAAVKEGAMMVCDVSRMHPGDQHHGAEPERRTYRDHHHRSRNARDQINMTIRVPYAMMSTIAGIVLLALLAAATSASDIEHAPINARLLASSSIPDWIWSKAQQQVKHHSSFAGARASLSPLCSCSTSLRGRPWCQRRSRRTARHPMPTWRCCSSYTTAERSGRAVLR